MAARFNVKTQQWEPAHTLDESSDMARWLRDTATKLGWNQDERGKLNRAAGDIERVRRLQKCLADNETEKTERGTEIMKLREALETIRDLPSKRTLLLNAEARAMSEIARAVLEESIA